MKVLGKSIPAVVAALLLAVLTGCGTDAEVTAFKNEIDSFCTSVSELDESINSINAEDENASVVLLGYLDDLDAKFLELSEMEFPEDFAYLEPLADEAYSYMSQAVSSYHAAYEGESYDAEQAEYAQENSARAFKYVQYLLAYLHGEDPSAAETAVDTSAESATVESTADAAETATP